MFASVATGLVNLLHPGCVVIIPFERGHVLSGSGCGLLWCHVIFIDAWGTKKNKKTTTTNNEQIVCFRGILIRRAENMD